MFITVNDNVTVTNPISFEALIVTEREVTAVVGVPEITPDSVFKLKPVGREPDNLE